MKLGLTLHTFDATRPSPDKYGFSKVLSSGVRFAHGRKQFQKSCTWHLAGRDSMVGLLKSICSNMLNVSLVQRCP